MIAYYYVVDVLCRVSRVHLELDTAFAYWRVVILMSICEVAIIFVCMCWVDIYAVIRIMS